MTETAVQISRCEECNADVRDESQFCYNCGAAVVKKADSSHVVAHEDSSPRRRPGEVRPPLRSAASLRKHRRAINRQPVQVTWERPSGSPIAFVIATIVLVAAAVGLLILALYLR